MNVPSTAAACADANDSVIETFCLVGIITGTFACINPWFMPSAANPPIYGTVGKLTGSALWKSGDCSAIVPPTASDSCATAGVA